MTFVTFCVGYMIIIAFYFVGLNGILEAYQSAVRAVQLYGPTNFSPVIRHVSNFAAKEAKTGVANVSITEILREY